MSRVERSRRANVDLQQIWVYVAQRNYPAADRLMERFEKAFRLLEKNPFAGEAVSSLRPNTRRFTVGNYVVLFELLPDGI